MIKPNELRVGNWIKTNGVFNMLDAGLLSHLLKIYTENPDALAIEPILISPAILEAAGFTQTSNYHPEGPTHTIKHRDGIKFEVCYLNAMVDVIQNIGRVRIQRIKYAHQLQNLYHALTGEELNISLPVKETV